LCHVKSNLLSEKDAAVIYGSRENGARKTMSSIYHLTELLLWMPKEIANMTRISIQSIGARSNKK
jgi:hypothetical protein